MAQNYKIASEWESDTQATADKIVLKGIVTALVGYPCKISCKVTEETVDIYVFSEKKKKVTDWIEIQPTGAVGVIYDFYSEGVSTDKLDDACEAYNTANNLEFDEGSDSGSGSDSDSGSDEEGQAEDNNEPK
jgi:hypothetical protein